MSDAAPSSNPGEAREPQPEQGSGGWLAHASALLCASACADEEKPRTLNALGYRQTAEQELIEPWIQLQGLWIKVENLDALSLRAIRAAL